MPTAPPKPLASSTLYAAGPWSRPARKTPGFVGAAVQGVFLTPFGVTIDLNDLMGWVPPSPSFSHEPKNQAHAERSTA